jgi:hypothetical protein
MLITAGVMVSTSVFARATSMTSSMVNSLASAWLETALLVLVKKRVLPDDFGLRVLRDEKDCLACKSSLLFSALWEQSHSDGFIEEQPSTSVRLRSA